MLRKAYLFLLLVLCAFSAQAAPKQLKVFFSFGIYSTREAKPYVEVYVKIPSATLNFKSKKDKKYTAAAKAQLYVLRNDTVVFRNIYNIETLPIADTNSNATLLDIKRFELPNGLYNMFLIVTDENDTLNTAHIELPIQVSVAKDRIQIADILFCDTIYPATQPDDFTRFGFNFIPSVSNIIEKDKNEILFYAEMYNALSQLGAGNCRFLLSIRNNKGGLVPGFEKSRTQKTNSLNYLSDGLDVSKLPGGEYYLRVSVLDKDNKSVAQRDKYFIRLTDSFINILNTKSNVIQGLTVAEIKEFVPYMEPIVSAKDLENYSRAVARDSSAIAIWFYNFWKEKAPEDPQKAYTNYVADVSFVLQSYGTMLSKGYRTDRGRIYLKYGKPDYIAPYIDEPNAYPYEIWHFYKTNTRNNVKFIFYNPTQIHNDFILLHSEMPQERQNPNWKRMIYRRTDKSKSLENDDDKPGNFGDGIENRIRE